MQFSVLGSGSKGNSVLVTSGGTSVLIDAGFSGIDLQNRLAAIGYTGEQLNALLVTHEHHDHVKGVGVLARRFKLPVYANASTHVAAEKCTGVINVRREFEVGNSFEIGTLSIRPFSLCHDAVDPVGFLISDGRVSFGYCTDTGKVTKLVAHHLRECRGLVLEANHDPDMLFNGPYPMPLKQRIRSNQGHLANEDAGSLLARLVTGNVLQHVVLAHLSEANNDPSLALATVRDYLKGREGLTIGIAGQDLPGELITLG